VRIAKSNQIGRQTMSREGKAYPGYCLRWAYIMGSSRLMRIWSLSVKNT
jgi:hypothetical protein